MGKTFTSGFSLVTNVLFAMTQCKYASWAVHGGPCSPGLPWSFCPEQGNPRWAGTWIPY